MVNQDNPTSLLAQNFSADSDSNSMSLPPKFSPQNSETINDAANEQPPQTIPETIPQTIPDTENRAISNANNAPQNSVQNLNQDDRRIGEVVHDRYKIVEKIASGGMAVVYKALDLNLDRHVALKIMHPHLAEGNDGEIFVKRFRQEARTAAKLHHEGIVTVYDQGLDGSTVFLTMEFVDGTNLRRRLKDVGTFSLGDALKNTESILRALAAAHRENFVHRDVKPENILINKRGKLQLADFGLARIATEATVATTGSVMGTVSYLAPEIISDGQCDACADCYAVGVILYEMLTGFQPYEGSTPIQIAYKHVNEDIPKLSALFPLIPEAVSDFISQMCSRDVRKRPDNADLALKLLNEAASKLNAADLALKLTKTAPPSTPAPNSSDSPQNEPSSQISSTGERTQVINPAPNGANHIPSFAPSASRANTTGSIPRPFAPENNDIQNRATNFLTADQLQTVRRHSSIQTSGQFSIQTSASNSGYVVAKLYSPTGSSLPVDKIRRGAQFDEAKRKKLTTLLSIILVALIAIGGAIWFFLAGPLTKVEIPSGLVGAQKDAAAQLLDSAALKYEFVQEFSDSVESGKVIKSEPTAGEKISKRIGVVKIHISQGVQMLNVPQSLVGNNFADVVKEITAQGFAEPEIHREYSTASAKDTVLAINFPEGSSQRHDIKIELKVSDGPRPVTMPNIVGSSLVGATAQLEKIGLKIESEQDFSDTVKIGDIISQATNQGDALHEGDTVKVTVSKGSKMVVVPDVVRLGKDAAAKMLAEAGLKYAFAGEKQKLNIVQEQSVKAGEKVERDTVITLTIV